jgi:hypothetical protein
MKFLWIVIPFIFSLNSSVAFDEGDGSGHEIMRDQTSSDRKHNKDNSPLDSNSKKKALPKLEFTVDPSIGNSKPDSTDSDSPKNTTVDMTPPSKKSDSDFSKTTKDTDQAIINMKSDVETAKVPATPTGSATTADTKPSTPPIDAKDDTVNQPGVYNQEYKFSQDGKSISGEEARRAVAGGDKVQVTKPDGTTKTIGSGKDWSSNNC